MSLYLALYIYIEMRMMIAASLSPCLTFNLYGNWIRDTYSGIRNIHTLAVPTRPEESIIHLFIAREKMH